MKKLALLLLITLNVIASGQSLKVSDTICLSLTEAKRLTYVKLNYPKLDSVVKAQRKFILLLQNSIESKRKLLDICYEQTETDKQQIELLKAKHEKELQIYKHKKTFWKKVKPYAIGFFIGAGTYAVVKSP